MPSISPAADHHRARISGISAAIKAGKRPPDDPDLIAAKDAFEQAKNEAWVDKVLASAPPLSDEQRNRLAQLLSPARQSTPDRCPTPSRSAVVASKLAVLDGGAPDA